MFILCCRFLILDSKSICNPFTPTRYPTWLKKIQLAFCKPYGGVKTISNESFSYVMQFSQKFVGHLCPSGWKRLFLHFHSSHIFFPLLSIMECYKPNRWRMFYFPYPPMHSTRIVFASFRNLANVLHDYQSIQVGSFSWMVSILVVLN